MNTRITKVVFSLGINIRYTGCTSDSSDHHFLFFITHAEVHILHIRCLYGYITRMDMHGMVLHGITKVILISYRNNKFGNLIVKARNNVDYMRVSVYRKGHFNAAHRLHNPAWSAEKNKKIFGLCNNENYHGHNYEIEVSVTGEVDPDTGYVYDMKKLADLIKSEVEDRFDHKNLNLDTEEFKALIPSAEHMAYVIYGLLRSKIDNRFDLGITLWETPRNYVKYPAGA